MIEHLLKCQHDLGFIREALMAAGSEGSPVDFLVIERLLRQTMELKKDIERFTTAKEIDEI